MNKFIELLEPNDECRQALVDLLYHINTNYLPFTTSAIINEANFKQKGKHREYTGLGFYNMDGSPAITTIDKKYIDLSNKLDNESYLHNKVQCN